MTGRRRCMQFFALAAAALAVGAALPVTSGAEQSAARLPYLALGDSIPFGYIAQAGYKYQDAKNFAGFPRYVGKALALTPTNASCPGETTASFASATGADNGCRLFRANFPLHVHYVGTQLAFAKAFLSTHPNTKLVTIQLGANDAFLLEDRCDNQPVCVAARLPTLLATIGNSMGRIYRALKGARFHGKLVVVNYYSPDYGDVAATATIRRLNEAITARASAGGAIVADAFTAFRRAAVSAAGHTCSTGLLNANPQNRKTCDVHPSRAGQELLARTVERAYARTSR